MPQEYWSDDGVKCSVNVMEHRASKRHQGGHAFQVLLAESKPAYTADGSDGTFAVKLSAKHIRKIHSLHSSLLISQTTIVVFKINSSFIFFQNYYFDNFETI